MSIQTTEERDLSAAEYVERALDDLDRARHHVAEPIAPPDQAAFLRGGAQPLASTARSVNCGCVPRCLILPGR
jgi:hypothetical protein